MLTECVLGLLLSVETIGELVNFGALLGFTILNFSVICHTIKHWEASQHNTGTIIRHILFPLMGLLVLLAILVSMKQASLIAGIAWLSIGIIYGATWSKGYKKSPGFS